MADQYVWTAADGTSTILSDWGAGFIVTDGGTTGLRSPSYDFTTAQYAGIDGAEVQSIKAQPAEPTLGLRISADSFPAARAKLRKLIRDMRPKAGMGTLSVSTEGGEARSLQCYYAGGLEGDDEGRFGPYYKAVIKFYAPDPWWFGEQRTIDVGLGVGANFFPIFPLTLAPSSVQGQFTVDLSASDAPAYPLWTITGPGSALVLTNQTTGRQITVNAALAAGETLVIDTRPGFQSVRRGDGANLMGSVTSDPALWPLVEDVNVVSAALTGATTASRIVGTFRPRYAGI